MLCPGVALSASLLGALELLVQAFAAPPSLAGMAFGRRVRMVPVAVSIAAGIASAVGIDRVWVVGSTARPASVVLVLLLDVRRSRFLCLLGHGCPWTVGRQQRLDVGRMGWQYRGHLPIDLSDPI